jgi:hypothetical protein
MHARLCTCCHLHPWSCVQYRCKRGDGRPREQAGSLESFMLQDEHRHCLPVSRPQSSRSRRDRHVVCNIRRRALWIWLPDEDLPPSSPPALRGPVNQCLRQAEICSIVTGHLANGRARCTTPDHPCCSISLQSSSQALIPSMKMSQGCDLDLGSPECRSLPCPPISLSFTGGAASLQGLP